MENTVASLLLVTSSVVIACLVAGYAVSMTAQTINVMDNMPQLDKLYDLENSIINQTFADFNQTLPEYPYNPTP